MFLWNHHSKGFPDVFIHPQAYMNIVDGVQNLQIPHTDVFPGACDPWRHVVDFYISDFQSGLRALVKTGYGARVTPHVEESVVLEVDQSNIESSPQFLTWLSDRNISRDDRVMRLKEGYIKEGSTVSVMGVVQRHNNVLMIVPPSEPVPVGCQWTRCLLPVNLEGIVLRCDDSSKLDVIPV
ncbi:hypothetical protein M8C21_002517 [Ambrosia artemisiifolia]|uniref:Uncharacterized protein n=2 Tax=Ambrosia artemisiifolia TaxID=4212 RepID=A0AAD5CV39_AMBAR|nr:hypothetical protein M8C21_002517 [Ambrosia artemisiifolia]